MVFGMIFFDSWITSNRFAHAEKLAKIRGVLLLDVTKLVNYNKKVYVKCLPKPEIKGFTNYRIMVNIFLADIFFLNFWDYLPPFTLHIGKFIHNLFFVLVTFSLYSSCSIKKIVYQVRLNWKLQEPQGSSKFNFSIFKNSGEKAESSKFPGFVLGTCNFQFRRSLYVTFFIIEQGKRNQKSYA